MVKTICRYVALLLLGGTLLLQPAKAQEKDSVAFSQNLAMVSVMVIVIPNQFTGQRNESIDSLSIADGSLLTDLLFERSGITVKTYGQGSLATPSFRGSSASHTAVRWNGFNLQSPTNGTLDFSLVPTFLLESVNLRFGSSGIENGSGAIGGAIYLNTLPKQKAPGKIGYYQQIGSFGEHQEGFNVNLKRERHNTSIKLFNRSAENNFPYEVPTLVGTETRNQVNAAFNSYGVMAGHRHQLDYNSELDVNLWYQNTDREIPPTITQTDSEATQQDEAFRASAAWSLRLSRFSIMARGAYFNETLNFQDPSINTDSETKTESYLSNIKFRFNYKSHNIFDIGFQPSYFRASSTGYDDQTPEEGRYAFYTSYKRNFSWYKAGKLNIIASLRQEIFEDELTPVTPALGLHYESKKIKGLHFRGRLARHYQIPTFNDRFWIPGGNPDLNPEEGWSQEFGAAQKLKFNKTSILFDAQLFSSNINERIIWLPGADQIWRPENLQQVWARGVESVLEVQHLLNKWRFSGKYSYNYTRATNEKTANPSNESLGKQLIYVPEVQSYFHFGVGFQRYQVQYRHRFTSRSYYTSSNSRSLDPFDLSNLIFSYAVQVKDWQGSAYFRINNVWDEDYQTIVSRAMPGRNYQFGLSIELFQKQNDK